MFCSYFIENASANMIVLLLMVLFCLNATGCGRCPPRQSQELQGFLLQAFAHGGICAFLKVPQATVMTLVYVKIAFVCANSLVLFFFFPAHHVQAVKHLLIKVVSWYFTCFFTKHSWVKAILNPPKLNDTQCDIGLISTLLHLKHHFSASETRPSVNEVKEEEEKQWKAEGMGYFCLFVLQFFHMSWY